MTVQADMAIDAMLEDPPRGPRLPALLPDGPVHPVALAHRRAAERGMLVVDDAHYLVYPAGQSPGSPDLAQALADADLARRMLEVVGAQGATYEEQMAWVRCRLMELS